MRIEDSDCFSLVVPTYQGTPFLRRLLDYLKAEKYLGHLLLTDNSSGEHREFARSCPAQYPELWLEVHEFDAGIGFVDKLARSLERLAARNVMLCGQDDYIVPEGVEKVVEVMEADPGLACARGRVARFHLRRATGDGLHRTASLDLNKYPMLAYEDADPLRRVLAHMRAYTSTLYSVHRRAQLVESLRATDAATRNVIFFQYLQSCITVALGRVACVDELFLARQIHDQSWSANLAGDYEHWPLLAAAPRYSEYYMQFRTALIALISTRFPSSADVTLGNKLDEAYLTLVRRALCRTSESDPANDAFFARLQAAGSRENTRVNGLARFTMPYEGTY